MSEFTTIQVQELSQRGENGKVDLIDVRTPVEFREVHASKAKNIPLDTIDPQAVMETRNESTEEPLYMICKSGVRAAKACQKFIDAGFTNVINVQGGTEAWVKAGLPIVRGKKAMSLERQVRVAAGSIVLVGSVAAMVTENLYLTGIPAFVGAGLLFAGVTDTCGMGMLLAKMPWNQCQDGSC